MSRKLRLALLALAVVWGLALLRIAPSMRRPPQPPSAPLPPEAKTAEVSLEGEKQSPDPRAKSPLAPPAPAPKTAPTDHREELVRLAAEIRVRNEARYARALARWPHEPRREPWASKREKELRGALEKDGIDGLVSEVECRASLCRIELSAQDSDAAFAVQRARTLQETVGLQVAVGMAGGGLDRVGIVFVARPDRPLDP